VRPAELAAGVESLIKQWEVDPCPKPMPVEPQWLSARPRAAPVGVDREAKVIRGYVVAQEGPFKSAGRGEFDTAALKPSSS
jgi:hypothetical protein